MRVRLPHYLAFASCFLLLLAFVIATANRSGFQSELAAVIRAAVDDGTRQFRLDTCVKGAWETVYVVSPYSDINQISTLIGCSPHELRGSEIEKSDSVCLLVFSKGSNVVMHVDCPRRIIDFIKIQTKGIHRKNATFDIELTPDGWRYALQLSSQGLSPPAAN